MQYRNIFDVEWNHKSLGLFIFLIALPNLLGMVNLSTPLGFKVHFFQLGIFLAAIIYGPWGGMLSGLFGSVYSALIMGNPYIVGGNAMLGFFAGLFVKYGFNTVISVLLAFLIQLPWLILTDFYLMRLPLNFIFMLVIALAASNFIWALAAHYIAAPLKNSLR